MGLLYVNSERVSEGKMDQDYCQDLKILSKDFFLWRKIDKKSADNILESLRNYIYKDEKEAVD